MVPAGRAADEQAHDEADDDVDDDVDDDPSTELIDVVEAAFFHFEVNRARDHIAWCQLAAFVM